MSKGILIVIVVAVLLMVALPVVGAQDVPGVSEPASDVIAPIDLESGFAIALGSLAAILGSSVTAPVTAFLVSVLKRWAALNSVSSNTLALFVAGILSVVATIAAASGRSLQFDSFVKFLSTVGPSFVLLLSTMRGAAAVYNDGKGKTWYGYERPEISNRLREATGQG